MNEFLQEALEKLESGAKENLSKHGNVMKGAVKDALADFCKQDYEFAQAVAQGGSFADCMAAVEKEIHGNAISDWDAFSAAAKFYFPGCGVRFQMAIDLCADVEKAADTPIVLDLASFF